MTSFMDQADMYAREGANLVMLQQPLLATYSLENEVKVLRREIDHLNELLIEDNVQDPVLREAVNDLFMARAVDNLLRVPTGPFQRALEELYELSKYGGVNNE